MLQIYVNMHSKLGILIYLDFVQIRYNSFIAKTKNLKNLSSASQETTSETLAENHQFPAREEHFGKVERKKPNPVLSCRHNAL